MFVFTNLRMNAVQVKKKAFLKEAGSFFKDASEYADEGDLQASVKGENSSKELYNLSSGISIMKDNIREKINYIQIFK